MESIIIFIVIIIVFNLLRSLMGSGRGQQPASRRESTAVSDMPFSERSADQSFDGPFFRPRRSRDTFADYAEEGDEYRTEEIKDEAKDTKQLSKRAIVKKSVHPTAVSQNLRQILNQKDPLVAAYIFHEIIASPSAQGKRRKSPFNRQR